jgi:hypothetical protein
VKTAASRGKTLFTEQPRQRLPAEPIGRPPPLRLGENHHGSSEVFRSSLRQKKIAKDMFLIELKTTMRISSLQTLVFCLTQSKQLPGFHDTVFQISRTSFPAPAWNWCYCRIMNARPFRSQGLRHCWQISMHNANTIGKRWDTLIYFEASTDP